MKNLFATFKKSIYDPEFYRTVSDVPLGAALRYYVRMSLVLAAFSTAVFAVILVPQGVRFVKDAAPFLVTKYYPSDLVIKIEKGEASANVSQPYIIPGKDGALEFLKDNNLENILVIDTTKDFDKKAFEGYKTFALLTKTEVVTQNNNGQITIQSLQRAPSTTIAQATLLGWVATARSILVYLVPVGVFITFIALFLGYAAYLIPLFIFALIPFFIAWIKKRPLTYGVAYRMSLYAVFPGLVLKTLLNVSGFFFVPAYLSLLVFMLVVSVNMRERKQLTLFK